MHSENILNIQQAIERILSDTQEVLADLIDSDLVTSNNEGTKQTLNIDFLKDKKSLLENESQKAANMEMVIAVVGTMKAGKSTTINAIVGQEILPNRALPMTALPTLVTHKSGQTVPVLTFNHIQPIIDLSKEITIKLNDVDTSSGYAFLGSKDGKALIKSLKEGGFSEIKEKYEGQEEIFGFLHQLNDLMRASKEIGISPPYKEYQSLNNLPRIEVEFYHLKNNSDSTHGRLSILDTPGPNEFGQSDGLKEVFRKQLSQASAVLLALDYTQLNSEADGAVREEVASIQQELGDRLFILVNKFDNASKNTMDAEATKTYVAEHLMGNKIIKDHIFPVSSWFAYLGNRALSELQTNGKINIEDDWVEDFGTEAFGRLWIDKIKDNKGVKEAAMALWEDSHFSTPLEKVITEAHAKVAFDSLDSTLNKLSSSINELDVGVSGRLSGLNKDIKSLEGMIEDLNNDQKQLDKVEKLVEKETNDEIAITQKEIKKVINTHITVAEKITQNFLETGKLANDEKKKERAVKEKESEEEEKRQSLFYKMFGEGRNRNQSEEVERALSSEDNKISFNDKNDAKKLTTSINENINIIKEKLLEVSEETLKRKTAKLQKKLKTVTETALSNVLEKAQGRLKDQGVIVKFQLPQFDSSSNIRFTMNDMLSGSIEKHQYESERSRVKDGWFSKAKNWLNDDWGKETYSTDETEYIINLKEIKGKVTDGMEQLKKSIEKGQLIFLENQLKEQVHEQINQIKEYLERYRGDLLQGIEDQKYNREKKSSYVAELETYKKPLKNLHEDSEDQSKLLALEV